MQRLSILSVLSQSYSCAVGGSPTAHTSFVLDALELRQGISVGRAPTRYQKIHQSQRSEEFRSACESIKRALDPNGIIAPGKYGIVMGYETARSIGSARLARVMDPTSRRALKAASTADVEIPPRHLVAGIPTRVLRELTDDELASKVSFLTCRRRVCDIFAHNDPGGSGAQPTRRPPAIHGRIAAAIDHYAPMKTIDVAESDICQPIDVDMDVIAGLDATGQIEVQTAGALQLQRRLRPNLQRGTACSKNLIRVDDMTESPKLAE